MAPKDIGPAVIGSAVDNANPAAYGPLKFSMRDAPVLADGAWSKGIATTENLWLTIKVYAAGGENFLHTHQTEDHAHVVLQGAATFHFEDGSTCEARPFEGIMLPKGAFYRFEAHPGENLVMLRVGAAQRRTQGIADLLKLGMPAELKGETIDWGGAVKNGRGGGKPVSPTIFVPGKTFQKD
jgi:mannose-6-phosphate isomerase-like protein (cupin superfamily)